MAGSSGARAGAISSLTVFSFVWAAQQTLQLVYFDEWVAAGNVLGYVLLAFTLSVMLFPGFTALFVAMLVASVVYFVGEWPFVVNHIVFDQMISVTAITAAVLVLGTRLFSGEANSAAHRDAIFKRFAPVAVVLVALAYYVILVSKLNAGFFDPEIGCMYTMYAERQHEEPVLRLLDSVVSPSFLFGLFMLIEILLPLLLTFRQTRLLALYIGLPFHFTLGLMWHWAFSSFILALFVLIAMPAVLDTLQAGRDRVGEAWSRRLVLGGRLVIVGAAGFAFAGHLAGYGAQAPFGFPVDYRMFVWLLWAAPVTALTMIAILRHHGSVGVLDARGATEALSRKPGWLWGMVGIAVVNCLSPYIGFKTQNNAAMYSNMQTEGGRNNHFFMPIVRIFPFQDDLVEVISSNDPEIAALRTHTGRYDWTNTPRKVRHTYFEFRRLVSARTAPGLEITYKRNGEMRTYRHGDASNVDGNLATPLPIVLAKVARFRPVFVERAYCLH